jgi:tetratricopeptide (TPR) repeat protein
MAFLVRLSAPLWLVTAVLTAGCGAASVEATRPGSTPSPRHERVTELSPIVVSPYSDADLAREFERAQKLLFAGKYREAGDVFDRLVRLSPDGQVAAPSLYNGGLAREGIGDREEALSRYREFVRRHPEHPMVKSGLVRTSRLLGYLERWDELGAVAQQLMARADLSVLEAIEARGHKALGLVEQDRVEEAAREVSKARDVIEEHRLGEAGKPPIELAPVSFALGEVRRRKSETIVFTPLPADFTGALERRCQGLLDAQGAYTEAMRGLDAHWSAMAGYRIGQLYQVLHRDIMQIPPPAQAGKLQDKQLFEGAMRLRYRVLLEKGLKMMDGTVRMGDRTGESSLWIARAREAKRTLELALQDEKTAMARLPYTEAELQAALDSLKTP